MKTKSLIPATLCALLVASPLAIAQATDESASASPAAAQADPSGGEAQTPAAGGMDMSGSEMMGMTHGGKRGGMGMMGHGGKGGGMGMMGCSGKGHGMSERYNRLLGRLDLLEARVAMMQTMLERLLER